MKKIIALAMASVLALGVFAGCGSKSEEKAESAAAVKTIEDGKLIMSTNAQFPPYELVSDGEGYEGTGFEGIDVEIAYAIAQKLGLELVVDDMEFDAALIAVQQNKSDVAMAGITYTDERDAIMDFTDSYSTGVQVIIVTEGSPVASADDLATCGKIGTQRGTTGYIYCCDDYGDDAVSSYDNGASAVRALLNGQVDAVVIDSNPAQKFVEENEGLKILDTAYAEEDYCIAVAEGNAELKDAVNNALAELKADGTVQAIVDKYISAN